MLYAWRSGQYFLFKKLIGHTCHTSLNHFLISLSDTGAHGGMRGRAARSGRRRAMAAVRLLAGFCRLPLLVALKIAQRRPEPPSRARRHSPPSSGLCLCLRISHCRPRPAPARRHARLAGQPPPLAAARGWRRERTGWGLRIDKVERDREVRGE